MGKSKHRTYAEKERDGEIKRLKEALRRKDKEMDRLKSELKTYEAAFQKNLQFLKGKTKDLTLQELLEGAKKEQNLKQIEVEKETTKEDEKISWLCKTCEQGQLKFIKIPRQDGIFYIRKCDNPKCKYATRLKRLTDEVQQ